jgi:adenylate cyclase
MEATFCFVDLAGFSALTETHGDDTGADLAQRFAAMTQSALRDDGRLVDTVGDAVFLASETPARMLRAVARLWREADATPDFPAVRAGIHHGDAVLRDGRWFGTSVNVAARVAALASGGRVLATLAVAAVARTEGISVETLGLVALKNIRERIELFSLVIAGESAGEIDPVCRMRVQPGACAGHLRFSDRDFWFCSLRCVAEFAANPEAHARLSETAVAQVPARKPAL